ncbi:LuxR family transcriptional regulator [Verrucomicrobiaceae bacterium SCGC AG-212-N21]|nr:LuxR family transcriptional regulator [Verrucomicrobiaceae bacterium SCGC AG-212-N21]
MNVNAETQPIKVVLVEDHPMFRERLAQLINKDLQMMVCGEADNILDAMRIIEEMKPDIAIVDITLSGSSGLELIKDLKARNNEVPVLVLSMHDELLYAERALRAGAKGYITKNQASSQVKLAVQTVLGGDVYLSPQMTTRVLRRLSKGTPDMTVSGVASLTDRELEVFRLLGCGHNSREIAQELGLGDATVNSYRFRIREKLGIRNTAELYNQAAQWVKEHGG